MVLTKNRVEKCVVKECACVIHNRQLVTAFNLNPDTDGSIKICGGGGGHIQLCIVLERVW